MTTVNPGCQRGFFCSKALIVSGEVMIEIQTREETSPMKKKPLAPWVKYDRRYLKIYQLTFNFISELVALGAEKDSKPCSQNRILVPLKGVFSKLRHPKRRQSRFAVLI